LTAVAAIGWQMPFDNGLVLQKTSARRFAASHPELLNWLAVGCPVGMEPQRLQRLMLAVRRIVIVIGDAGLAGT
jgi:hypothetical protein